MSEVRNPPSIRGYRILGPLGAGSMGTLWKAVDADGQVVAIKVAERAHQVSAATRDAMFRREAVAALNVRDPSLVRGLDVGSTEDGRPFLTLEFVEGETLAEQMRARGPLPEADVVALGHAVASALEHAHRLGLLHRDVKPANVMLQPDGRVKLVDLSLVTEVGRGESGCGSPGYASPEMIRKECVGPASDLYALGATLAAAVLGQPFFRGATVQETLRDSLRKPLVLPERVAGRRLSEDFRAVVSCLGNKRVAERYGSAAEVRLDFEALRDGERPLGAYLRRSRPRGVAKTVRRVAAAALVLSVAALIAMAEMRRARPEPAPSPSPQSVPLGSVPSADAHTDAVLMYVEAHPDEFERGRALLGEARARFPDADRLALLAAAGRRVEERFRSRAGELLAERTAAARTLRDKGDYDGMVRTLTLWPSPFESTPQATEAADLVARWQSELRVPGDDLLREGAALLTSAEDPEWGDLGREQDLSDRLERLRGIGSWDAAQRAELELLRSKLAARIARLTEGRRRFEVQHALTAAFEGADRSGAEGLRVALSDAAGMDEGATGTGSLIREVLARAAQVETALAARLTALEGGSWAAVLDGRWFVGPVGDLPTTRDAFAPGWVAVGATGAPSPDYGDLLAVVPDGEMAASWVLVSARPRLALAIAPVGGPAESLLRLGGVERSDPVSPRVGAWADLLAQFPLLLRVPGTQPAPQPANADPVIGCWTQAILARLRGDRPVPSSAGARSAALAAARAAFLRDDWGAAWKALDQSVRDAPAEAEIAVLRSQVATAASRPLPTLGASLESLVEARRAWDLDPTMPVASRILAQACLRFFEIHPGALAEALRPVALAACDEAVRLGQADVAILAYAGRVRLRDGRAREAVPLLRRASRDAPEDGEILLLLAEAESGIDNPEKASAALARASRVLGPAFPTWAREMQIRLSRR